MNESPIDVGIPADSSGSSRMPDTSIGSAPISYFDTLGVSSTENEHEQPMAGIFLQRHTEHPAWSDEEVMDIDDITIQQLTQQQFREYLDILIRSTMYGSVSSAVPARNFGTIINRMEQDILTMGHDQALPAKRETVIFEGEDVRILFGAMARTEDISVEPAILEKLYSFIHSDNNILRHTAGEMLREVLVLDTRNEKKGTGLNLHQRYFTDLVDTITHPEIGHNLETATDLISVAQSSWGADVLRQPFIDAITRAPSLDVIAVVLNRFAEKLELGKALKLLRAHAVAEPAFLDKLNQVEEVLGIKKGEGAQASTHKVYAEKFDIGEYDVYDDEGTQHDIEVIDTTLGNAQNIVEIGCGTGRLLHLLSERGKNVSGFDFVEKYIQKIKDQYHGLADKVLVGSWFAMPYEDAGFDAAYWAGRSAMNNTTVDEYLDSLGEVHRILVPGGVLVMDLANPKKGQFAAARKEFSEHAAAVGISNVEAGLVHDSPNNVQYVDRFIPSDTQFQAMATLKGFRAEKIEGAQWEYKDASGLTNENVYWKLTKMTEEVSPEDHLSTWISARTAFQPLRLKRV